MSSRKYIHTKLFKPSETHVIFFVDSHNNVGCNITFPEQDYEEILFECRNESEAKGYYTLMNEKTAMFYRRMAIRDLYDVPLTKEEEKLYEEILNTMYL